MNFNTLVNIYYFGNYYNPADKRYYPGASVRCDRCLKNNIDICVGWDRYDLCLTCISDINAHIKKS